MDEFWECHANDLERALSPVLIKFLEEQPLTKVAAIAGEPFSGLSENEQGSVVETLKDRLRALL